jgi:ABC-type transport system involved in multi-copper enzyme maturation permease subunit
MIAQLLAIARNAFVESLRQPAMLFITLISGILQVLIPWMTGYAMGLEETGELEGDNKLQFDVGLSSVFVCATILAAFIATATLSREIENKTALTIVSKPIGRPTIVVGKYLGVSGALLIALGSMVIFLLISVSHGVMSNAADNVDAPAIVLGLGAVLLAMVAAAWTNFFYGWNFSQMATVLMLPLLVVAVALVLSLDQKWTFHEPLEELKPQVTLASAALGMAVMVLTSVAVAASTRLSQVMTVFLCLGVFVGSLLTNYFIGRYAFRNESFGIIAAAQPTDVTRVEFDREGDTYTIDLTRPPNRSIAAGSNFYWGTNANGFDLATGRMPAFEGDVERTEDLLGPNVPGNVIVTRSEGKSLTVRNIGGDGAEVRRPPQAGDYVFTAYTGKNYAAMVPWAALPNMHYFWLLDAVSQNSSVPGSYLAKAALYALLQIGAFLSLAVVLFQRRDVA